MEKEDVPLQMRETVAELACNPMAKTRWAFAKRYPGIRFNASSLRDALITDCGQSAATVDELTFDEAANLLSEPMQTPERQSRETGPVANDQSIPREAFRAVIDGGLAGVLGAAEKAPSRNKVSEVMLNMLAADSARYSWPLKRWVAELGCTRTTIVGNRRRGVSPCGAWAEILAWRESNKQNRFPKKPAKKN